MSGRDRGFTLIEMLIVMAIFGIVLAGTTQMVVSMLTVSRQQGRITESNVEGILGLNIMRQDLAKAGYGLPWNGLPSYGEAVSGASTTAPWLNDAPTNAPRGIVARDGLGMNGSDYLAIKAMNVATNSACDKWAMTWLDSFGTPSNTVWTSATSASDNFATGDWVVILEPGSPTTESTARILVNSGGSWYAQYPNVAALASSLTTTGVEYGVDDANSGISNLRMPFNRADYFIDKPSGGTLPQRCAPGTGILYKAVVSQKDGTYKTKMPLLDCVADMEVVFRYVNGGILTPANPEQIAAMNAQSVRDQVKEVRVYILTHEGAMDRNFTYTGPSTFSVGEDNIVGDANAHQFPLSTADATNWQHYRWREYTLVVQLTNLK